MFWITYFPQLSQELTVLNSSPQWNIICWVCQSLGQIKMFTKCCICLESWFQCQGHHDVATSWLFFTLIVSWTCIINCHSNYSNILMIFLRFSELFCWCDDKSRQEFFSWFILHWFGLVCPEQPLILLLIIHNLYLHFRRFKPRTIKFCLFQIL